MIIYERDAWLRWTGTGREWCCICRGMASCRTGEVASRHRFVSIGVGSTDTIRVTRCSACGFEQVLEPSGRTGPADSKDRALQIREPIRGIGRMLTQRFPSTKIQRSVRFGVIVLGVMLGGVSAAAHVTGCAVGVFAVVAVFLAFSVIVPFLGRKGKVLRLLARGLRPLSPSAAELRVALSQESPELPVLRGINPDELAEAVKKARR